MLLVASSSPCLLPSVAASHTVTAACRDSLVYEAIFENRSEILETLLMASASAVATFSPAPLIPLDRLLASSCVQLVEARQVAVGRRKLSSEFTASPKWARAL